MLQVSSCDTAVRGFAGGLVRGALGGRGTSAGNGAAGFLPATPGYGVPLTPGRPLSGGPGGG